MDENRCRDMKGSKTFEIPDNFSHVQIPRSELFQFTARAVTPVRSVVGMVQPVSLA
jgi:hypothetical protein